MKHNNGTSKIFGRRSSLVAIASRRNKVLEEEDHSNSNSVSSRSFREISQDFIERSIPNSLRNRKKISTKRKKSSITCGQVKSCTSKSSFSRKLENHSKDGQHQKQHQIEMQTIADLEKQIEDIEQRKRMDLQNIKDWKNEKKWKLDRRLSQRRKLDTESERKAIEASIVDRKNSTVEKFLKLNNLLREKLDRFEKEKEESIALNIQLRDEYKQRDAMLEKAERQFRAERHTNQSLLAFDKKVQILIDECRSEEEAYESNLRAKQIFHKAIENIIKLLGDGCTDMELLFEIIPMADKLKKKDFSNPNSSRSTEARSSNSCEEDMERDEDHEEDYDFDETRNTNKVKQIIFKNTNIVGSDMKTASSIASKEIKGKRKEPQRKDLPQYNNTDAWDHSYTSYTSILEDTSASSIDCKDVYVTSVNPIIICDNSSKNTLLSSMA